MSEPTAPPYPYQPPPGPIPCDEPVEVLTPAEQAEIPPAPAGAPVIHEVKLPGEE